MNNELCDLVRRTTNCAILCGERQIVRYCAENGKMCDIALTALKCCLWCVWITSNCYMNWNFKPRAILKLLFWPKRREFVGPKFWLHSLYVIFCKNPGFCWSEVGWSGVRCFTVPSLNSRSTWEVFLNKYWNPVHSTKKSHAVFRTDHSASCGKIFEVFKFFKFCFIDCSMDPTRSLAIKATLHYNKLIKCVRCDKSMNVHAGDSLSISGVSEKETVTINWKGPFLMALYHVNRKSYILRYLFKERLCLS
jgi:hypothetical protein